MFFLKELTRSQQYKKLIAGSYCDLLSDESVQLLGLQQNSISLFVPDFKSHETLEKLVSLDLYDNIIDGDKIMLSGQSNPSSDAIVLSLACEKLVVLKFDDIKGNFMRTSEFDLGLINQNAPSEMYKLGHRVKCFSSKVLVPSFMGSLLVLSYDNRNAILSKERVFTVRTMISDVQYDSIKNQVFVLSNDYSPDSKTIKVLLKNFSCKPESKEKVLISTTTAETDIPIANYATSFLLLSSGAFLYANQGCLQVYYPRSISVKRLLDLKDELVLGFEECVDCVLTISEKSIIILKQECKTVSVLNQILIPSSKDFIIGYNMINQNMRTYMVFLTQESIDIFRLEIDVKAKSFILSPHYKSPLFMGTIATILDESDKNSVNSLDDLYCLKKIASEEKNNGDQVFSLSLSHKMSNLIGNKCELPRDINRSWLFEFNTSKALLIFSRTGGKSFALDIEYAKNKFTANLSTQFNVINEIIEIFQSGDKLIVVCKSLIFELDYAKEKMTGIYSSADIVFASMLKLSTSKALLQILLKTGHGLLLSLADGEHVTKVNDQLFGLKTSAADLFTIQSSLYYLVCTFEGEVVLFNKADQGFAKVGCIKINAAAHKVIVTQNYILIGCKNGEIHLIKIDFDEDTNLNTLKITCISSVKIGESPVNFIEFKNKTDQTNQYFCWNDTAALVKIKDNMSIIKEKVIFSSSSPVWFHSLKKEALLICIRNGRLQVNDIQKILEYNRQSLLLDEELQKRSNTPSFQKIFVDPCSNAVAGITADMLLCFPEVNNEIPYHVSLVSNEKEHDQMLSAGLIYFGMDTLEFRRSTYKIVMIARGDLSEGVFSFSFATLKKESLEELRNNSNGSRIEEIGRIKEGIEFRVIDARLIKDKNVLIVSGRKDIAFYSYILDNDNEEGKLTVNKIKKRFETNARSFIVNIDVVGNLLLVGDNTAGITVYEVETKSLGQNLGFTVSVSLKYVDLQSCLLNHAVFTSSHNAIGVDKYGKAYVVDFEQKKFTRMLPRLLEGDIGETGKLRAFSDQKIIGAVLTGISGGIYLVYTLKQELDLIQDAHFSSILKAFEDHLTQSYRTSMIGKIWSKKEKLNDKRFLSWNILNKYNEESLPVKAAIWSSFKNGREDLDLGDWSYERFSCALDKILK